MKISINFQFNNIQVSRRYKHFDWLHERLVEKYTFVPIPPLPDKQIQGKIKIFFIQKKNFKINSVRFFYTFYTSCPHEGGEFLHALL